MDLPTDAVPSPAHLVPRRSQIRANGVDLHVEVAGTGEPVLFLHGGFCSLESLRDQAEALARDFEVHAFERPGHGRSADVDGEYSYARGLTDTLAYLDAAGLSSAHVVGYSDGAILGLQLAMDHPERVRSLVAISANLDPSGFVGTPASVGIPVLEPIPVDPDAPRLPDAERLHYDRLSPDGPEHAEVVLAKLMRLWTREPSIAPTDLARITAPTLIMAGDRDTIRPDHTTLIAASIPRAQLCIVPGTSHGLISERPALIGTIIRAFLPGG